MANRPFTQSEVNRLCNYAKQAGLTVTGIQLTLDGHLSVSTAERNGNLAPPEEPGAPSPMDGLDRLRAKYEAEHERVS